MAQKAYHSQRLKSRNLKLFHNTLYGTSSPFVPNCSQLFTPRSLSQIFLCVSLNFIYKILLHQTFPNKFEQIMNFISFRTASTPILHAGPGMAGTIGEIIKMYGERILLITGAKSFDGSDAHLKLFEQLKDGGFEWQQYKVGSEPSLIQLTPPSRGLLLTTLWLYSPWVVEAC